MGVVVKKMLTLGVSFIPCVGLLRSSSTWLWPPSSPLHQQHRRRCTLPAPPFQHDALSAPPLQPPELQPLPRPQLASLLSSTSIVTTSAWKPYARATVPDMTFPVTAVKMRLTVIF